MSEKWYHLVLSWWWLRWFAHIGVYRALVERAYTISSVAWTSVGALIGAFIAAQKSPDEIEEIFTRKSFYKFLRPSFFWDGFFSIKEIKKKIKKDLKIRNIGELPLPFTVCVTDFWNAKPLYYMSWNISELVIASCSIPGIFNPVQYDDKILIDGGVFDNMPIITNNGLPIIASHVNPRITDQKLSMKTIAIRALEMMLARDINKQAEQCEIFIEPPEITEIWLWITANSQKIIEMWYEYACKILD